MSFLDRPQLSAGELITAAFGELANSGREILIYLAAFLGLEIAGALLPTSPVAGLVGLALLGAYFVGQYLLYRTILRRSGHVPPDGRIRIFRFIAIAIVIGLALLFASYLFLIPAIIVGGRWVTAPCYIVATDKGVFASLGESWSATSGNTLPMSLAFLAMVLIFGVALVVFGAIAAAIEGMLGVDLTFGFVGHFLSLLLMGLSIAAYRRLNDEGVELAAVFA